VRYALIAVAIGASLVCLFVAWRLWLGEQVVVPGYRDDPDYTVVAMLVVAAVVLAFAAGGLIARRAEGAYLLGVAAFMLVIPLAGLGLLSFITWDTTQGEQSNIGLLRIGVWGAFAFDVWVGVRSIRLGRQMSDERLA
jgi:hypothetical protein